MPKIIGIDLGTTNSAAAVVQAGEPVVINNAEGGRLTPSVVGFSKTGERLVGQAAKRQAVLNPERTVVSIKRRMGTRDKTTVDGKDYTPEQISAMILQKLKRDAEAYLGEPVKAAVITVPAYFDDNQRTATKQAGEIAGFEVKRIINEPTAAALAYGFGEEKKEATILVYDLGGGTFDVSILDVEIDKGSETKDYYEVLSTSGDTHLGGDDFDERLIDHIAEEFKKENGIDLRKDRQALSRLKEAAEKAKCELSTQITTSISLPFITSVDGEGPKHLELTVTRAKFEELIEDLVKKTEVAVRQALKDAKLAPSDVHEVLLVGGSTRIPCVQKLIKDIIGKEPRKGVNPDEAVALGAAIQAAVLGDEMQDMVLVDVTPLSLGVETLGGVMTKLVERNTSVPHRVTETFSTASDFQNTVEVHVLQGERERAADNKSLGRFHLTGIPPAPRGVPQIEVTFDLDANGILNVSAQDKATGKQQSITITGSGQLNDNDVQRMVKESEQHAEEDRKFRELADARNSADQLAYQLERSLNDLKDAVTDSDRDQVRARVEALRNATQGDNVQDIRSAIDEANRVMGEISQRVYEASKSSQPAQEAAADGTTGSAPPTEGGSDEVIDAEFTAEDEQ